MSRIPIRIRLTLAFVLALDETRHLGLVLNHENAHVPIILPMMRGR